MRPFNVVQFINAIFTCIILTLYIATPGGFASIYDEILPLELSTTRSYVVFDLLLDTDDVYPLGVNVKAFDNGSKEFTVDDQVVFGKEVKVVFGNKCVSLTSFARNIKLKLQWVHVLYHVHIQFELHGSKILREYTQTNVPLPGFLRRFKYVVPASFSEKSGVPDIEEEETHEEAEDAPEDEEKAPEPEVFTYQDVPPTTPEPEEQVKPAAHQTPSVEDSPKEPVEKSSATKSIDIVKTIQTDITSLMSSDTKPQSDLTDVTDTNLSNKEGYKDAYDINDGTTDYKCVLFENKPNVLNKLGFKGAKIPLWENAQTFEVCHCKLGHDHHVMVSSQFSSLTVEQNYKYASNALQPSDDFTPFSGLESYPERKLASDSQSGSTSTFELEVDNYAPDLNSHLEKVESDKCVVYRYVDGLEDESRVTAVTSLKFGTQTYQVPSTKRFVMVSKCTPYLSTIYVTIMLKDFFLYESVVFHSVDGNEFRQRRVLGDEDRMKILNMTSKVWHKRQSNGAMGNIDLVDNEVEVLCLAQFTDPAGNFSNCKVDKLHNFELLYHAEDFTTIRFKKRAPKSSVTIGNIILDLETDNNADKQLYISHPRQEPVSVLVLNTNGPNYSLVEKSSGSNTFVPATNVLASLKHRFNKKDLNVLMHRGNTNGITWDYNEFLKKRYLFPSRFPEYCLGDIAFHNTKIISHRHEGYKHIFTANEQKPSKITITAFFPNGKVALEVSLEQNKGTKIKLLKQPTSEP